MSVPHQLAPADAYATAQHLIRDHAQTMASIRGWQDDAGTHGPDTAGSVAAFHDHLHADAATHHHDPTRPATP